MTTKTKGRELILDRQHLVKMLADPAFYVSCPYFLWLRNTALRAHERYESNGRNDCRGCGPDFRVMKPVIDAFFTNLKELKELDPSTVECVRQYLEDRKGYPISLVVIMYQSSGTHPQKLRFHF